jgi:hypothetical protein
MPPAPGRVVPGRVPGPPPGRVEGNEAFGRETPPIEGRLMLPGFVVGRWPMLDIEGRLPGREPPEGRDMLGRDTDGPPPPPGRPMEGRAPPPPRLIPPPPPPPPRLIPPPPPPRPPLGWARAGW